MTSKSFSGIGADEPSPRSMTSAAYSFKTYPARVDTSLPVIKEPAQGLTVRRIRLPTFRGRHNNTKTKVLIVLRELYCGRLQLRHKSLTVSELAYFSGTNVRSVATMAPRWVRWNYIYRTTRTLKNGQVVYTYSIKLKGLRWVNRWLNSSRIPAPLWVSWMRDMGERLDFYYAMHPRLGKKLAGPEVELSPRELERRIRAAARRLDVDRQREDPSGWGYEDKKRFMGFGEP